MFVSVVGVKGVEGNLGMSGVDAIIDANGRGVDGGDDTLSETTGAGVEVVVVSVIFVVDTVVVGGGVRVCADVAVTVVDTVVVIVVVVGVSVSGDVAFVIVSGVARAGIGIDAGVVTDVGVDVLITFDIDTIVSSVSDVTGVFVVVVELILICVISTRSQGGS